MLSELIAVGAAVFGRPALPQVTGIQGAASAAPTSLRDLRRSLRLAVDARHTAVKALKLDRAAGAAAADLGRLTAEKGKSKLAARRLDRHDGRIHAVQQHADQRSLEWFRRLDPHELFRRLRAHLPADPSVAGDEDDNGIIPVDVAAAHLCKT